MVRAYCAASAPTVGAGSSRFLAKIPPPTKKITTPREDPRHHPNTQREDPPILIAARHVATKAPYRNSDTVPYWVLRVWCAPKKSVSHASVMWVRSSAGLSAVSGFFSSRLSLANPPLP